MHFAIQDARAVLARRAEEKPIESRRPAAPSAGQRSPEDRIHPHVIGNSKPKILPLPLYPDVVDAPLDDLLGDHEAVVVEYLV